MIMTKYQHFYLTEFSLKHAKDTRNPFYLIWLIDKLNTTNIFT